MKTKRFLSALALTAGLGVAMIVPTQVQASDACYYQPRGHYERSHDNKRHQRHERRAYREGYRDSHRDHAPRYSAYDNGHRDYGRHNRIRFSIHF